MNIGLAELIVFLDSFRTKDEIDEVNPTYYRIDPADFIHFINVLMLAEARKTKARKTKASKTNG